jgi:hypothetical protein
MPMKVSYTNQPCTHLVKLIQILYNYIIHAIEFHASIVSFTPSNNITSTIKEKDRVPLLLEP